MANTLGYAAGTAAATVDVPAGSRLRAVWVIGAATVAIAGGATITVPAATVFNPPMEGDVADGANVVIGGTPTAYFVSWMS